MSLQTSKRDHLEKVKIYFRKFSNSLQAKIQWEKLGTLTPQHGKHLGQSSKNYFSFDGNTNVKFKIAPNSRNQLYV